MLALVTMEKGGGVNDALITDGKGIDNKKDDEGKRDSVCVCYGLWSMTANCSHSETSQASLCFGF